MKEPGRAFRGAVAVACAMAGVSGITAAQERTGCAPSIANGAAPRTWPAPLDRPVSLGGRDLALRDAIDRLAAAARLRISYVSEALPLDRRECVAFTSAPVGDVLVALLDGTGVVPVIAGGDHVVLSPPRVVSSVTFEPPRLATTVGRLDRIVVTGSTAGAAQRSLPYALDVVPGTELARRDVTTLSGALDGAVPGLWIWEQSPASLLARYGSIRGASSFGVSYPKIYIDGIEVANPLLVTQLDPQAIERVEVIRGPQGAALYGADAISGVINIVSRHGGVDAGLPRAQLRSTAGMSASDYAPSSVLAQTHALGFRTGTGTRSAGLSLSLGSLGEFVPGAYARQLTAGSDLRIVGARTVVTGIGRFFGENAGAATSPILTAVRIAAARAAQREWHAPPVDRGAGAMTRPGSSAESAAAADTTLGAPNRQSVRQYTVGATASLQQKDRWTHTFTAGVDGYRLTDASILAVPFPSPADSALRAAQGGADRGTVRASSVMKLGAPERTAATFTLAAEHSSVREHDEAGQPYGPPQSTTGTPGGPSQPAPAPEPRVAWRANTGLIAQGTASMRDALFLTVGGRLERSTADGDSRVATLPMAGVSWVRPLDVVTVKLRGAYGRGIRAPQTTSRGTTWLGMRQSTSSKRLESEEQSGTELGADLIFGRPVALHITRFDQLASGLIQPVAVAPQSGGGPGPGRRIPYQLQNVGEITNRGWEVEGTAGVGALSVSGAFSTVESRVKRIARGYGGDLRAGDRVLEVPKRTLSLTASWLRKSWNASGTVARASDWINYDRLAIAELLASSTLPTRDPVGGELRTFWRQYDGVTRLRASLSRQLRGGVSLVATGDNLLGYQEGEPDNVTIVPGRTISVGARARF